jgi:hypothetical protein
MAPGTWPLTKDIIGNYGDNMIRTQISLEEDAYLEAKREARQQGISLAEFLRRLVAAGIRHRRTRTQPWLRHAGAVASGDPDASTSVDTVVYGRPRP